MELDYWQVIQSLLALIVVLGLILLVTFVLKRYGGDRIMVKGGDKQVNRLDVVEVKMIDAKRRLVLVRRDDKEHLLLLSPDKEMVIEFAIDASETVDA